MADAYLKMSYLLELTDKDMRLVCLGLSGRLARPEDKGEAAKLNVRLLKLQSVRIHEQQAKIDGALKKAQEEAGTNLDTEPPDEEKHNGQNHPHDRG